MPAALCTNAPTGQWGGLLNHFYRPCWAQFFGPLAQVLATGQQPDLKPFEEQIKPWEWRWVNKHKAFPTCPAGHSVQLALRMHQKYRPRLSNAYR